ncbi:hypothetical protein [Photobacterium damselae]|uniref:hypothetical protein n=1 Tax=Photobacterium damselae TaxID=38293 RepID=UPI004069458D
MTKYSSKEVSKYNLRGVSYWFFKSVVCAEKLGERGFDNLENNISELRKLHSSGDLPSKSDFISIMMSNIRKSRYQSNLSYSDFDTWWDKGVMAEIPTDIIKQQGQLNRGGVVCGHIYDLITGDVTCTDIADELLDFSKDGKLRLLGKTAVAKAIDKQSEKLREEANKKDPLYQLLLDDGDYKAFSSMVDDINEVIQNSWGRIDFGNSRNAPLTPLQVRLDDFTKTIAKAISTSDALELLAWVQTSVMHKDFVPSENVARRSDGTVDMKQTLENIYEFSNQISPTDKDIFRKNKYINPISSSSRSNNAAASYKFSKQPSSMPDVFYMEDGELKIAFASTSRDTSIERNQFIRHTIEAGFYNAWLKENLNEFERLDNDKVSESLYEATASLKCDKDSMMWFKRGGNNNDLDNYTAYTKKMLTRIFENNPSLGSEADVLSVKASISDFAKLGQVARSVLYTRLVGLSSGDRSLNELLEPELSDKDLKQILPKENSRFYTRTCTDRSAPFLSKIDTNNIQNRELRDRLELLKSADEKSLFRGLQRMAFQVTQDSYSGFKISGDATSKILNSMDFVTGVANTNLAMESNLAKNFMSVLVMATQEPDVMLGLLREMSDVAVMSGATLQNSYGGKLYSSGLYQEERSNIMRSIACVSNEVRKNLLDGGRIDDETMDSMMNRYFGDGKSACLELIKNEGLVDLAECLSQVRLADSESTEVIDSMCSAAEAANFRVQRSLISSERKNKISFKI